MSQLPPDQAIRPYVGRQAEFATACQALARTQRHARMQVVEIVADPGMGKTRLLEELAAIARGEQWLVAAGRAAEFGPLPPLGLLVDALDDHLTGADLGVLEAAHPGSLDVLAAAFPGLAGQREPVDSAIPAGDYRLMRAIRALLSQLSGSSGLLLILDDMHRSDPLTVEVLDYLLRHPPKAQLLVAVAYRPRQATPRLVGPLLNATREGLARRIVLPQLTAAEADLLLDPQMRRWQRDLVYRLSGGNPTYLEILAAGLGPDGGLEELPRLLIAPLLADIHALSGAGRLVGSAAAVVGDCFDPQLLGDVAEIDETEALHGIDELLSHDIVRSVGAFQQFRFRHPLVRQVAYEATSGGWRLGAHTRAAAALAQRMASPTSVAHHIGRAAAPRDAASTSILVDAAVDVLPTQPALAAGWLDAALQLRGEHSEMRHGRLAILDLKARALTESGRLTEARAVLAELLEAPNNPNRMSAVLRATDVDIFLCRLAAARRRLRAELAGTTAPDTSTTMLALALACVSLHEDRPDLTVIEWAVSLVGADARGSVRAYAQAMLAAGRIATGRDGSAPAADIAADLLDGQSDKEAACHLWALVWLSRAEIYLERYDLAREHANRGTSIANASGQVSLLPYLMAEAAEADLRQGRLTSAAATVNLIEDALAATGQPQPTCILPLTLQARIAAERGDAAGARTAAGESVAAARTPESGLARAAQLTAAYAQVHSGRWQHAVQAIVDAGGGSELAALWVPVRVAVFTDLVRIELTRGRPHAARQWLDQAHAHASPDLPGQTGRTQLAGARLVLPHDPAAAAELANSAAQLFVKAGNRIDLGRAQLVAALALERSGADRAARETRAEGVALLTESGAEALIAMIDEEHRVVLEQCAQAAEARELPVSAVGASAPPEEPGITILSERELQIAELVGHGHTNRQIARLLSISHKTVETYLARIFTKLDVSSRASVAKLVGSGVLIAGRRRAHT